MTGEEEEVVDGRLSCTLLMSRISDELLDLRDLTRRIEHGLEDELDPSCLLPGTRMTIQQLDRMGQTLACLAGCLEGMATEVPPVATVSHDNSLGRVPLDSVLQRLRTGRPNLPDDDAGEPELL